MKKLIFLSYLVLTFSACSEKETNLIEKEAIFKAEITSSKSFGGTLDEKVTSAVETKDGGMLGLGYTNSTDGDINKTHDLIDIWLAKIDNNGNKVWSKTIGGSLNDYISRFKFKH